VIEGLAADMAKTISTVVPEITRLSSATGDPGFFQCECRRVLIYAGVTHADLDDAGTFPNVHPSADTDSV
jgi:hypothetical protein